MERQIIQDEFDWRGCDAVQYDPEKLSGRATVGASRMEADSVLNNSDDGLTAEEIADSYGLDLQAVEKILAFAESRCMKAGA